MKSLKALLIELKQLKEGRDAYAEKICNKYAELAELSPIKPGDIVKCNAYTHQGKKIIVERVEYFGAKQYGIPGKAQVYLFRASGPIIKKDGKPSEHQSGERYYNEDG